LKFQIDPATRWTSCWGLVHFNISITHRILVPLSDGTETGSQTGVLVWKVKPVHWRSIILRRNFSALHGGVRGFDKVWWTAQELEVEGQPAVRFTYTSPDGEEGYPGTLQTSVTYRLDGENGWHVDYAATTDRATPVNLTQHTFFNLKGEGNGDILDHEVTVHADVFYTGEFRHDSNRRNSERIRNAFGLSSWGEDFGADQCCG
jgi:galactose mutarotase-like enzyme